MTARMTALKAAAVVARRDGAANLTLDAVAREAGISKGGLLYHFPSKEALLRGLLELYLQQFDEALEARQAADPRVQGRWARAYLDLTLGDDPQHDPSAAVLAAVAHDPALLGFVREHYAAWQERAEADGLAPGLGTLLRLAADGLWLSEFIGLAPPRGEVRAAFADVARALSQRGASEQEDA